MKALRADTLPALPRRALPDCTAEALEWLPLRMAASRFDLQMPRLRWVFYAFYPRHLAVL